MARKKKGNRSVQCNKMWEEPRYYADNRNPSLFSLERFLDRLQTRVEYTLV